MSADELSFDEASHTYRMRGRIVPSVTQILQPLSGLQFVPRDILDAAARFGSAVHKACELADLGILDERAMDPALAPYLAGWRAFCHDWSADWTMIEGRVYNSQFDYAGTLDRAGRVKGAQAVVDIKSSAELYATVGPQLAAYQKALPGGGLLTQRIGVLLRPDGTYHAQAFPSLTDWSVFASLLTLRRFCAQHRITPYFPQADQ